MLDVLGFNPVLQKFYEMIFEKIFSKTLCGLFLIFCGSCFINNFVVRDRFSEPQKLSRNPFILKKIPLEHLIWTNKLEGLKIIFSTAKSLIWPSHFCAKIKFYDFFQVRLFNFNAIFKTCLNIYLKKLTKNGDFTLLVKSLEPYKLP